METAPIPMLDPSATPLEIAIVLYPGMTLLDLTGPQTALNMHGNTRLFWKTLDPVMSDSGIALVPTATFAEASGALDVLFVPGGSGTVEAMKDEEIVAFVAEQGRDARYVTSVCTGSLLLGQAGLLDGYRAATHWATYPVLEALGVEAGHERVVIDRNRVTGGGITAGIDFGLTLVAELRGDGAAKLTQLLMEYDPAPPFDTGSPQKAGPELAATAASIMGADWNVQGAEVARSKRSLHPQAA